MNIYDKRNVVLFGNTTKQSYACNTGRNIIWMWCKYTQHCSIARRCLGLSPAPTSSEQYGAGWIDRGWPRDWSAAARVTQVTAGGGGRFSCSVTFVHHPPRASGRSVHQKRTSLARSSPSIQLIPAAPAYRTSLLTRPWADRPPIEDPAFFLLIKPPIQWLTSDGGFRLTMNRRLTKARGTAGAIRFFCGCIVNCIDEPQ